MIDAVRVAMAALHVQRGQSPGPLIVVRIQAEGGALLGLDDRERPHLLLPMPDSAPWAPESSDIAALDIEVTELVIDGINVTALDVICLDLSLAEVFEHFIVAVLARVLRLPTEPAVALNGVLERWRRFLTSGQKPLSREKQAALIGELLVLIDVLSAATPASLDCWVGPSGGRHDFRRSQLAVEVKVTRSHSGRQVTIHGVDQLDPPLGGTLHVHFVRLEDVPAGGVSVASLVDDLLTRGAPAEHLFDALARTGIALVEIPRTSEVSFEVRERFTVPVDATTPRITPGSFASGLVPVGVVDVNYAIDLDHVFDTALSEPAYVRLMSELASGVVV